jgi:TolB-like protein
MTDGQGPAPDPQAGGLRLDSWKEIAAYLRRDVRTVQRWEQTDGLPIHRHRRAHRPIPYAYKTELDAWWTGRSDGSVPTGSPEGPSQAPRDRRVSVVVATLAIAALAAAGAFWVARSRPSPVSAIVASTAPEPTTSAAAGAVAPALEPKSVAVLPFVDLTEGMTHEEFADGMAEEIINRLNTVPGYRVPAPASTFYFKNKNVPVADIARALGVVFVADGSVRRSGATVRVAVRLIRAAGADVIWSETYDRPWNDVLRIQDDIAGTAAQAITRSIEARANPPRP